MSVPAAPHTYQHLVLSVFRTLAILIGAQCYTIVLIRISLLTWDVEQVCGFLNQKRASYKAEEAVILVQIQLNRKTSQQTEKL